MCHMALAQEKTTPAAKSYIGFTLAGLFGRNGAIVLEGQPQGLSAKTTALNGLLGELSYSRRLHPNLRWAATVTGAYAVYGYELTFLPEWFRRPSVFAELPPDTPIPWQGFEEECGILGGSGSLYYNTNAEKRCFLEGHVGAGALGVVTKTRVGRDAYSPEEGRAVSVGRYEHRLARRPLPFLRAGITFNVRLTGNAVFFTGLQGYWTFQDIVTGDLQFRSTVLPVRTVNARYNEPFDAWSLQLGLLHRLRGGK
jgi:hypothetical protein